jgi:hypothetical protein
VTAAIFSDLDGTLIYSKRYLDGVRDVVEVEGLGGKPLAWMTSKSAGSLRAARGLAHFIPTSTRVLEQYERLRLPGGPADYAILGNGGRIYVGGAEDSAWTGHIRALSAGVTPPSAIAASLERELVGESWVREIRYFDDIVCVTAHRGAEPHAGFYDFASDLAAGNGYASFPQGRKTHLIPSHITKEAAAAEVAERLGVKRTFAAGDHALDAGIMRWADDATQPAHGADIDGIRTTRAGGAAAADEITRDFIRFAA